MLAAAATDAAPQQLVRVSKSRPLIIRQNLEIDKQLRSDSDKCVKLFSDIIAFEPPSLDARHATRSDELLGALREWLMGQKYLVYPQEAIVKSGIHVEGKLRPAEHPLESVARETYANERSRRSNSAPGTHLRDTLRQEVELRVRVVDSISRTCRLMPPCPFIGLNKPPMIQTREMRLPFCFRCRQDLDSHCRRDPIVVTILLSEATSSPLAALADALDVLLEGDDSCFDHVTQPTSAYTEGEDEENDQDEEDEGLDEATREELADRLQDLMPNGFPAPAKPPSDGGGGIRGQKHFGSGRPDDAAGSSKESDAPHVSDLLQALSESLAEHSISNTDDQPQPSLEDGFEEPPPLPEGAASSSDAAAAESSEGSGRLDGVRVSGGPPRVRCVLVVESDGRVVSSG